MGGETTDHNDVKTDIPLHTNGHPNGTSCASSYQILEEPSRLNRPIKVITIGAGASALNLANTVNHSPLNIQLTCYEKNPEIGGTW